MIGEKEFKEMLARKIKVFRKEPQNKLAEEAQLSDYTISSAERGKYMLKTYNFLKICIGLKVTPNDLLEDFLPEEIKHKVVTDRISKQFLELSKDEQDVVLTVIKTLKNR